MTLIIHREAPKAQLVTMGQANKEIEMGKEVSYESNPELYHLRPGTTEPELKPGALDSTAGAEVIKKEPADKEGAIGGAGKPKVPETSKAVGKKK